MPGRCTGGISQAGYRAWTVEGVCNGLYFGMEEGVCVGVGREGVAVRIMSGDPVVNLSVHFGGQAGY